MDTKRLWVWVCLFFSGLAAAASSYTNDLFAFGLRHSVITNAEITLGESAVYVLNTAVCDDGTNCTDPDQLFGASIHLVAADSGIFVSPQAQKVDGASLEGKAYATLDGTNGLIGSVKGTRLGFGEYKMEVDFTPVGATSYVYEVFYRELLVLKLTNDNPQATILTSNYEPTAPRINPLWLSTNRPAVIVDFKDTITEVLLPGIRALASRVVVRPQTEKFVGWATRVDVFGRGGLDSFALQDERIGKFRLYHRALGDVTFGLGTRELILSNLNGVAGGDQVGMFTELPRVREMRAHMAPHTVTNQSFKWSFDAVGVAASLPYPTYLGGARLSRENGALSLSSDSGTGGTVRVYHQGAFVGSATEMNGSLGTLLTSNITLLQYTAGADTTNGPAYMGVVLSSAVTLSNTSGVSLSGDEFRITPNHSNGPVSALTLFTLTGENLGDVWITRMPVVIPPPEPLRLDITRVGQSTRVSWPHVSDNYYLYGKKDLNSAGWSYIAYGIFENGRDYADVPTTNSMLFMSLRHIFAGGGLVHTNL